MTIFCTDNPHTILTLVLERVRDATCAVSGYRVAVGVPESCAVERAEWQDWLLFLASHVSPLMAVLASASCRMYLLQDLVSWM
jgi:hypothetical protein